MITIQRMRIAGSFEDPLLARLRLERLLAAVQLRTIGPSARIVIRYLPDPLPGAIDLHRSSLRPPLAWEQAFCAQIESAIAGAARPITSLAAGSASVVFFADDAEYLACLSMDWVRGELSERWWWRTILKEDSRAVVERVWAEKPTGVPAALDYLTAQALHELVLQQMDPTAIDAIHRHLLEIYGLPVELASLTGVNQPEGAMFPAGLNVPEVSTGRLSLAARKLLFSSLVLARHPADGQRLLRSWLHRQPVTEFVSTTPTLAETKELSAAVTGLEVPPVSANRTDSLKIVPPVTVGKPVSIALSATIVTRYGGLFFLLNVALALRLYGDFTEPAYEGLPLCLWDWLAMLGARLCGNFWSEDALAALLAGLAGRDPLILPGGNSTPPAEWLLPLAWLDAFPGIVESRLLVVEERAVLVHPASFILADLPLADGWHARINALACSYGMTYQHEVRPDIHSEFAAVPVTWSAWMNTFVPYLRARLLRALDLPLEDYLALPARVFASATHIDVVFQLADLPISVRLAGLDRDIGWLPAAGRVIRFYFE